MPCEVVGAIRFKLSACRGHKRKCIFRGPQGAFCLSAADWLTACSAFLFCSTGENEGECRHPCQGRRRRWLSVELEAKDAAEGENRHNRLCRLMDGWIIGNIVQLLLLCTMVWSTVVYNIRRQRGQPGDTRFLGRGSKRLNRMAMEAA